MILVGFSDDEVYYFTHFARVFPQHPLLKAEVLAKYAALFNITPEYAEERFQNYLDYLDKK